MERSIYLSDNVVGFKAHRSLEEKPIVFENHLLRGCVFYLPVGGKLGGDTFIVKEDNYLTVFLLSDMAKHGGLGRSNLGPFIKHLERMAETATSLEFKEGLVKQIVELDKMVSDECMIALSFLRITSSGGIHYLNAGENQLILYKGGIVHNPSSEIS
mgnify:FL=1